jgi:hypothetical protein
MAEYDTVIPSPHLLTDEQDDNGCTLPDAVRALLTGGDQ